MNFLKILNFYNIIIYYYNIYGIKLKYFIYGWT